MQPIYIHLHNYWIKIGDWSKLIRLVADNKMSMADELIMLIERVLKKGEGDTLDESGEKRYMHHLKRIINQFSKKSILTTK